MAIQIHTFTLEDISLNMDIFASLIGDYTEATLPEPYPQIIKTELEVLPEYVKIKGGYRIIENFELSTGENNILINGLSFHTGHQVIKYLKNAEKLAFYICTAGEGITRRSQELINKGLLVEGYITDMLGSIIVEEAMNNIHRELKKRMEQEYFHVSNRYSPGYCNWNVSEQHKLFSLFPPEFCGVTLTTGALMSPIKSVSGVIGIGKEIKFHKYICDACSDVNCIYRNKRNL